MYAELQHKYYIFIHFLYINDLIFTIILLIIYLSLHKIPGFHSPPSVKSLLAWT